MLYTVKHPQIGTQMFDFIICLAALCAPIGIGAAILGLLYPEEW